MGDNRKLDFTPLIELKDVYKYYEDDRTTAVLNDISLYVKRNEFLTLLGPSGCGKTTTLRVIGGFEALTKGELRIEGKSVLSVPPYRRPVNTVFQKYALFPHLNVFENVAFGLRIKKIGESEVVKKVNGALKLINLEGYGKRPVSALSGGQQQRVAIARALVNEPKALLMDEPLGALDLKLRKEMQRELKNIQRELGITFLYVTHDQEEALTMSDTIAVMNKGVIQQIGSPTDIYNEPKNAFVADFIGESNIINGVMRDDFKAEFCGHVFDCLDKGFGKNESVDVVVRPEDVDVVAPEAGMLRGRVASVTFKGVHYEMMIKLDNDGEWMIHSTDLSAEGSEVGLSLDPDAIHIMKREASA